MPVEDERELIEKVISKLYSDLVRSHSECIYNDDITRCELESRRFSGRRRTLLQYTKLCLKRLFNQIYVVYNCI